MFDLEGLDVTPPLDDAGQAAHEIAAANRFLAVLDVLTANSTMSSSPAQAIELATLIVFGEVV